MNLKRKCQIILSNTDRKENSIIQFGQSLRSTLGNLSEMVVKRNHLYILSDDKIKTGDWVLDLNDNSIFQIQIQPNTIINKYKKIIATTNLSLAKQVFHKDSTPTNNYSYVLPQPSPQFIQKFIEEWNKDNKITEIMVDYWCGEQNCNCTTREQDCFRAKQNLIPKVDKNNQITITKVKDSWSREEVIELLLSLNKDKPGNFDCSAWISENL